MKQILWTRAGLARVGQKARRSSGPVETVWKHLSSGRWIDGFQVRAHCGVGASGARGDFGGLLSGRQEHGDAGFRRRQVK